MGMASDHLAAHRLDDIIERETAFFLGELGMIDGLEKKVSKLLAKITAIAAGDCIGHLVSLFDRIGCNRIEALFEIPWAARFWRAQRLHDGAQGFDPAGVHIGRIHGGAIRNSHNVYYGRFSFASGEDKIRCIPGCLAPQVSVESSASAKPGS